MTPPLRPAPLRAPSRAGDRPRGWGKGGARRRPTPQRRRASPAAALFLTLHAPPPQRKREEFWDTQPYYGGSKGERPTAGPKHDKAMDGPGVPTRPAQGERVLKASKHPTPHPPPTLNRNPHAPTPTLQPRTQPQPHHPQPPLLNPPEIWDVLKAAIAAEPPLAKVLLEAADVKVVRPDMSASYDSRGFRYDLPQYVLADPTNLLP